MRPLPRYGRSPRPRVTERRAFKVCYLKATCSKSPQVPHHNLGDHPLSVRTPDMVPISLAPTFWQLPGRQDGHRPSSISRPTRQSRPTNGGTAHVGNGEVRFSDTAKWLPTVCCAHHLLPSLRPGRLPPLCWTCWRHSTTRARRSQKCRTIVKISKLSPICRPHRRMGYRSTASRQQVINALKETADAPVCCKRSRLSRQQAAPISPCLPSSQAFAANGISESWRSYPTSTTARGGPPAILG